LTSSVYSGVSNRGKQICSIRQFQPGIHWRLNPVGGAFEILSLADRVGHLPKPVTTQPEHLAPLWIWSFTRCDRERKHDFSTRLLHYLLIKYDQVNKAVKYVVCKATCDERFKKKPLLNLVFNKHAYTLYT